MVLRSESQIDISAHRAWKEMTIPSVICKGEPFPKDRGSAFSYSYIRDFFYVRLLQLKNGSNF